MELTFEKETINTNQGKCNIKIVQATHIYKISDDYCIKASHIKDRLPRYSNS